MNLALNIFNFVFFGFSTVLGWFFATILSAVLIVTLPYTRSCWEITKMALVPFGHEIVHVKYLQPTNSLSNNVGSILNIIWFVVCGWWLCLLHIMVGISQCVTIIGIPSGIGHFKLAQIALFPVGQRVVSSEMAQTVTGRQFTQPFDHR
ncbi:YccF domain-containing protein [Testudinibacter sp. P80/BLE/0925]|uniref:YccF domain-containing protein n=1 Tax=Testudinibacter sp. TW-1 TaxID=3417757 RepID=UPI003D369F67